MQRPMTVVRFETLFLVARFTGVKATFLLRQEGS